MVADKVRKLTQSGPFDYTWSQILEQEVPDAVMNWEDLIAEFIVWRWDVNGIARYNFQLYEILE